MTTSDTLKALLDKWKDQASLLEQSAIRHRAMSSMGLAEPEEVSARELRNCARQLEALLASEPTPPDHDFLPNYTTGVDRCAEVIACCGKPASAHMPAEPTPPAREPRADVRGLAPASRPETGPMRFGGDWCGVFIRGDNAAGYALALGLVLDGHDRSGLYATQLRGLIDLFAGCTEMNKPQAQQATLTPAPADIVTIRQQIGRLHAIRVYHGAEHANGYAMAVRDVLSLPSLSLAEVVTVQASEQAPAKPEPLE